jgi:hypothetical protein
VSSAIDLLCKCSAKAEQLSHQRGELRVVLLLAENANGKREFSEVECDGRIGNATDAELLDGLAADTRLDLEDAGAVAFAVAYTAIAHRIICAIYKDPPTEKLDAMES